MSLKNKWRRVGGIEIRRETSRLSDGSAWGDVLWIRTPKIGGFRRVAYCFDRKDGRGVECGDFRFLPAFGTPRNAVTIAKAMRRHVKAGA